MSAGSLISSAISRVWQAGRFLEERRALSFVLIVAVMIACAAYAAGVKLNKPPLAIDDFSAAVASDMLAAQRAYDRGEGQSVALPGQSRSLAVGPGYAFVIYAVSLADEKVGAAVECYARKRRCDEERSFASLVFVQTAIAILGLLFVFAAALRLSASWEVALLTFILVFVASRLGDFAGTAQGLVFVPFLTYLFIFFIVEAYARANLFFAFGAGVSVSLATLFMPQTLVLGLAGALCLAFGGARLGRWRATANSIALVAGLSLLGEFLVLLKPLTYDPAGLVRLQSALLSERVGFQQMGFIAWLASLIEPVPFLDGIADALFPKSIVRLFGLTNTGSLTAQGLYSVYPQALSSAKSAFGQLAWIVRTHVLGDLAMYIAVTPSLVIRGMWAGGGLVALAGLFHIKRMCALHRADKRSGLLAAAFIPCVVLLVVQALVTGNHYIYNPALVFLYAYAIASVVGRFEGARS